MKWANQVAPTVLDCERLLRVIFPTPSGGGEPAAQADLSVYATNTDGASGIALRPSDGALFAVNSTGLFGPIEEGDDFSTLSPIGATNLADADLFDQETSALVLAITNSGEFWIGSPCCQTLAVVPPDGGAAVPSEVLLGGVDTSNIKPETMALVPEGFQGPQIQPGNLLVGQETTFSRLGAIDVDAEEPTVIGVENPGEINRHAHHLTFGLDGTLYSSRGVAGLTIMGLQTIDTDGLPTELAGSLGVAADSFVGLVNGDLVIRGTWQTGATESTRGVLYYSAADQEISVGLALPTGDMSEDDEMVITPDGSAIFLCLPSRNEILRVVDLRE